MNFRERRCVHRAVGSREISEGLKKAAPNEKGDCSKLGPYLQSVCVFWHPKRLHVFNPWDLKGDATVWYLNPTSWACSALSRPQKGGFHPSHRAPNCGPHIEGVSTVCKSLGPIYISPGPFEGTLRFNMLEVLVFFTSRRLQLSFKSEGEKHVRRRSHQHFSLLSRE